jgi:hypothetical protein
VCLCQPASHVPHLLCIASDALFTLQQRHCTELRNAKPSHAPHLPCIASDVLLALQQRLRPLELRNPNPKL